MNIWGISDVGAVRKQNQDAYYVTTPDAEVPFAVVCDGMGGAKAGNVASTLAVESFVATLSEGLKPPRREVEPLLRMAVDRANELVCYRSEMDADCRGMGTTLVAAVVEEDLVRLINVGDSRAYLVTGQGIRQLTRDHSVVEDLVERGEITHEEARSHPQKNLITRALGTARQVKADLFRETVEEGEAVLLCSDGLLCAVTDEEIHQEFQAGGAPEDICRRLLERTLSGGAPDNVTIVLLQV